MEKIECSKCKVMKGRNDFYDRSRSVKTGKRSRCKQCETGLIRPDYEPSMEGEKSCIHCKEIKSVLTFVKHIKSPDGRGSSCRDCSKKNKILKKYNITVDQYYEHASQTNCKICDHTFLENKRDKHVDHCHKSGDFRGTICQNCNRSLGMVKDKVSTLLNMVNYLNKK
jgi:hypothetical protein